MDAGQIITDSSRFVYGRLCSIDRNLFNYIILSEVYLCRSWLSSNGFIEQPNKYGRKYARCMRQGDPCSRFTHAESGAQPP